MSLGSGRDGSAREAGRRAEFVVEERSVERAEELGGREPLESFLGILRVVVGVVMVMAMVMLEDGGLVFRCDGSRSAPRWGAW